MPQPGLYPKEYARGNVHENRAECLFVLLKPYLRVFRRISKTNLPGYVHFFQCLRNYRQLTACEQAEMILYVEPGFVAATFRFRRDPCILWPFISASLL